MTRYLFICFVSLLAFVACKNEPEYITSERGSSQIIHVRIDEEPHVRVALNGIDMRWTAGDNLQVYEYTPSGGFSRSMNYTIVDNSITEDGKSADFSGKQMLDGYKYIAYYGSSIYMSDREEILMQLSNDCQQGTSLEHINNAINMSSEILTYDGVTPLDFKFRHLSTILEFNLKLAPSVVGECSIAGIDFFAPGKALCSQYTINSKGDIAVGWDYMMGVQNLQISGAPSLSNSISFKAQMACLWNPAVATMSNDFIIKVRTTDGREATITRPAKVLRSGVIYYINEEITPIDMVEQDKQALIAFYHATNGDSWRNKSNWCSDKPLNSWLGVVTDFSGRVQEVSLINNNLSGSIPSEIKWLSELHSLVLRRNMLEREIPAEIGNLVKLSRLELDNNNLTGTLPSELSKAEELGRLQNSFNVSYNRLSGKIPDACLAYKYFADWVLTPQQAGYGFTDDSAIKLNINRKDVPSSASTFNIQVSSNQNWYMQNVPSWITFNPSSGNGNQLLTATCQANTTLSERSATITFIAGNYAATLTIVQPGQDIAISLDINSKEVPAESNRFNVALTANTNWTVSGMPDWITLDQSSGSGSCSIRVICSANTIVLARDATITFTAGGASTSLHVKQAGAIPTISLDGSSRNFESIRGSFTIKVATNGGTWSVTGIPEWLSLSSTTGTGNQEVIATHQANPIAKDRYATLVFTAGKASVKYELRQYAASGTISIDKQSWAAGYGVESTEVNISTNQAEWFVYSCPSWVSVSPERGSGSGKVVVSCSENLSATPRTASIQFRLSGSSDANDLKTLQITQQGQFTLSVSTSNLQFEGGATSKYLSFTSNTSWTATKDQNWFTISPVSGSSDDGNILITVMKNTTKTVRRGVVTITAGTGIEKKIKTVNVTQYVTPKLSVASQSFFAPFWASSYSVALESNTLWSATSDQNWCTSSPASGNGNGAITITLLRNTSDRARTATVTITAGTEGQGYVTHTLTIRQNPYNDFSIGDWTDNGDHGGDAQ